MTRPNPKARKRKPKKPAKGRSVWLLEHEQTGVLWATSLSATRRAVSVMRDCRAAPQDWCIVEYRRVEP